ncbi:TreTu family toxin [Listeria immobilis]|uniref:TreTu family toxin n=2 Tax=Listeria immobilis TaxID=2713502 RepID=UPI003F8CF989
MSSVEYKKMKNTGKVQMSKNGNRTYVSYPADKNAFPSAADDALYAEFKVDEKTIFPAGKEGWAQIPGPGSLIDRFNQKKGLPAITEMPEAIDITNLGGK